jgi:hypothetical protein
MSRWGCLLASEHAFVWREREREGGREGARAREKRVSIKKAVYAVLTVGLCVGGVGL